MLLVEALSPKPQISEPAGRVLSSSEIPFQVKPLTTEQITKEMMEDGNADLHQRRADALTRERLIFA